MTKSLWAPWRMDYILGSKPDYCVLCKAIDDGPDKFSENMVLYDAPRVFALMNRYPYSHGHIMIVPRRHLSRPSDLDAEEQKDLFDLVVKSCSVLDKSMKPQGMNIGMNLGKAGGAGIEEHLHVHIVPRWSGDTNFMPILADTKVMPEHLSETFNGLKRFFLEIEDAKK